MFEVTEGNPFRGNAAHPAEGKLLLMGIQNNSPDAADCYVYYFLTKGI